MRNEYNAPNPRAVGMLLVVGVAVLLVLVIGRRAFVIVPPGHVAVGVLFGEVQAEPYREGLHFPVNPLLNFVEFDAREKSHRETSSVPSQDQLNTEIDVSVQYRIMSKMAPQMLQETGVAEQAVEVHLVPKLRSVIREQGKTIRRAEDFFAEATQSNLQAAIFSELQMFLEPKGIEVQAVLLRDIRLPPSILQNVERKKQAEQEVERERAELARAEIESQRQVVTARAMKEASELEAQRRRLIAEAQAFEIEQINRAIANNPAYIQLEALKALQAISKDPAAKMYFLNGDSPMPLPLMHMGAPTTLTASPESRP